MTRVAILAAVVIGLCGFPAALLAGPEEDAPAAVKAGLKVEVLKQWVEKQYTDMGQYATKKETLDYQAIRYGAPREGHPLSDGVPDNKTTTVYPIKMTILHTITYTNENVVKKQKIEAAIVAFQDEFGDWTIRLKENKVEPVK